MKFKSIIIMILCLLVNAPPVHAAGVPIYWGALVKGVTYGLSSDPPWDMTALDTFESHAGRKVSLLHFGLPWYSSVSWPQGYYSFNPTIMTSLRSRGVIPFIDWSSADSNASTYTNQPNFSLSSIISGNHDSYIAAWATAAKNWGHPFFLRFDWEMNGTWYPWSEAVNGNSTGQFVLAWRHVHDIFKNVGANNVSWVWCPNTEYSGSLNLDGLYPGDTYVDWNCFDGYNWGTGNSTHPDIWKGFYTISKTTYDHLLTLSPNKPIIVGETASGELGGSKASWISDMLGTQLPSNFPKVKGVLWFDWNTDNADWVIETSTTAQAAFNQGINSGYFAASDFANLNASPIVPIAPVGNGDANDDGLVNALDLKSVPKSYLTPTTLALNQYRDTKINALDFVIVLKRLP